ncbi:hypothetical protein [Brevibacterium jeotgali]|uniref:Uncharacterized protein n=1 Tax=Brevibacterium jeotgali TaxID=1262550 RepID=A0A2H1L4V4_9MICO|nr:hypothetical protein [Brevibacterium jeotgali]TWC01678.1 hypothetical protein FB108_0330 [Brevibacterium jeotgali]SMY11423.1 hypothetical protein BJEO58_01008 [Brevibacterium jeotgali]
MNGLFVLLIVAAVLLTTLVAANNSKSTRAAREGLAVQREREELAASIEGLERELEVGDHSPEMKAEAASRAKRNREVARRAEAEREASRQAAADRAAVRQAEAEAARIAGLSAEEREIEARAQRIMRRAARPEAACLEAARRSAKEEIKHRASSEYLEKGLAATDRLKGRELHPVETRMFDVEQEIVESILAGSEADSRQRALAYINARTVELQRDLVRHQENLARYRRAHEATEYDSSSGQAQYFRQRRDTVGEQIDALEAKLRGVARVQGKMRQMMADEGG